MNCAIIRDDLAHLFQTEILTSPLCFFFFFFFFFFKQLYDHLYETNIFKSNRFFSNRFIFFLALFSIIFFFLLFFLSFFASVQKIKFITVLFSYFLCPFLMKVHVCLNK